MKLYCAMLVVIGLLTLAVAGCMAPILKIEKRCVTGKFGGVRCECRDRDSGQFVVCPAEWRDN